MTVLVAVSTTETLSRSREVQGRRQRWPPADGLWRGVERDALCDPSVALQARENARARVSPSVRDRPSPRAHHDSR